MRFVLALFAVALASVSASVIAPVIQLGDENFEHLTQASSGATTGDWFIKFYAPWCGHCKNMASAWAELAVELQGKVNVAEVDCTVHAATCKRFDVQGFPTLLHMHRGELRIYEGERDLYAMKQFTETGYAGIAKTPMPAPPSRFALLLAEFEAFVERIHWHEDPIINAVLVGLACGAALLLPLLALLVVYECLTARKPAPAPHTVPAAAQQEDTAKSTSVKDSTAQKRKDTSSKAK